MPLRRGRDTGDLEGLPGEVVHAAEHHQGDLRAFLLQERLEVFRPEDRLPLPRLGDEKRFLGIESVMPDLRLHGVGVGGKRAVLHQDLVAIPRGTIERHENQVEVDREGVHHHDLAGMRPDQTRAALPEDLVVGIPGGLRLEMSSRRERLPVLQLLLHEGPDGARLEPEGVAAQIDDLLPVGPLRDEKALAQFGEGVFGVELPGERRVVLEGDAHDGRILSRFKPRNSSAVPERSLSLVAGGRSVSDSIRRPGTASPSGKG